MRRASGRTRRAAQVNRSSVLEALPRRVIVANIAKAEAAKGKSPVYLRKVPVRWTKEGKTKRVMGGVYQKVVKRKVLAA